jgi:hypothetical protein
VDTLVRYRAWIVMGVVLVAVILATTLAGRQAGNSSGTSLRVRFGPLLKPPARAQLAITNGWMVTSGSEQVAVYVGSQAHHPRNGLLIVTRRPDRAPVGSAGILISGSGALTLLRPPHFSSFQAANTATLRFLTASGNTDTLNLANNHITR